MDGTIKNYDVIVIGSGNGGLTAAIRVLQAGRSCLLVTVIILSIANMEFYEFCKFLRGN